MGYLQSMIGLKISTTLFYKFPGNLTSPDFSDAIPKGRKLQSLSEVEFGKSEGSDKLI